MARFVLSSLAVLALLGCQKGSSSERITLDLAPKKTEGKPLVTFKGGAITVEEVNRQLATLPLMAVVIGAVLWLLARQRRVAPAPAE